MKPQFGCQQAVEMHLHQNWAPDISHTTCSFYSLPYYHDGNFFLLVAQVKILESSLTSFFFSYLAFSSLEKFSSASKYIQNLVTLQHLHCYHGAPVTIISCLDYRTGFLTGLPASSLDFLSPFSTRSQVNLLIFKSDHVPSLLEIFCWFPDSQSKSQNPFNYLEVSIWSTYPTVPPDLWPCSSPALSFHSSYTDRNPGTQVPQDLCTHCTFCQEH